MEEVYVKRYRAIDGTLFTDEDECEKYEESPYCKIKSKIMPEIEENIKKLINDNSKLPF